MAVIFERNDGLRVVSPETFEEASRVAAGATWRVATDRLDFAFVIGMCLPVVVVFPGVGRFLFAPHFFNSEISSEDGSPVPVGDVWRHWDVFEPVVRWALRRNGGFLKYVPPELRTRDMCLSAIRLSPASFCDVPGGLHDRELCLEAVSLRGDLLMYVPKILADYDVCLAAVRNDGYALRYVETELIDERLVEVALETCGEVLELAPSHMIDRDLFRKAVLASPEMLRRADEFFDGPVLDARFCEMLVRWKGDVIEYLPEEFLTADICRRAVHRDPGALSSVPIELIDDGTLRRAVRSQPSVLQFVPDERKTRDLCLLAVVAEPSAIFDVPEKMRDEEVRSHAHRSKWSSYKDIEGGNLFGNVMETDALRRSLEKHFGH